MFFIKVLGVLGVLTLFFVSWFNAFLGLILFFLYKGYKYRFNNLLIYYFLEFFILFYSGWFYTKVEYTNREILLSDILYIFPYFLLCYCIYKSKLLLNKYKDLEYSLKRYDFSISICLLLLILSLVMGIINHDPLLSIVVITSITFYFYSFLRSEYKDLIRSFTYPLAIFNLFLMTIFPYLFIFHFILFYISKYYNWHRFDIHHPTFLVDND